MIKGPGQVKKPQSDKLMRFYKRIGRPIVLVYSNPKSGGAILALWREGSSSFGLSLHSIPREGAVISEQFYHVFGKLNVSWSHTR